MAESIISQSSNNGSSSSELSIPPQLKFELANIKSIVSIPLVADTYPMWSSQVSKLLKANEYEGFLDESSPCPPKFLPTATDGPTLNPQYRQWQFIDQNLSAAILATISTSILPYVLNLDFTTAIWQTLQKRLQATNRSRVIQLKHELHRISLKNNTMTQYLSEFKALIDQIAAAGSQVDSEDILLYILNILPPSYQAFKMAIRIREGSLPLNDLYSLLTSEEINISNELIKDYHTALYSYRARGRSSNTCGRSRYNSFKSADRPTDYKQLPALPDRSSICCQICNKIGHSAANCWHRTNLEVSPPTRPSPHQAFMAHQHQPTQDWVLDTGAIAHLTSNLNNLQIPKSYHGHDTVSIGNGSQLPIAHIGHAILPTPTRKFSLRPLLHVPHLSHNLLSVHSLAAANNCYLPLMLTVSRFRIGNLIAFF